MFCHSSYKQCTLELQTQKKQDPKKFHSILLSYYVRVFKHTLKLIPKSDAIDIVDLWARENKFNDYLPFTAPETKTRFVQTDKIQTKNIRTNTEEIKAEIKIHKTYKPLKFEKSVQADTRMVD